MISIKKSNNREKELVTIRGGQIITAALDLGHTMSSGKNKGLPFYPAVP